MSSVTAAVAATRFGLGLAPGELERRLADPVGSLEAELGAAPLAPALAGLPSGADGLAWYVAYRNEQRARAEAAADMAMDEAESEADADMRSERNRMFAREVEARARHAATTDAPFRERLVRFWSNHFSVSARPDSRTLVGPFEREAIRPHVAGRFVEMLKAVTKHPAMLVYLNQNVSIGPNTRIAQQRDRGLNENLAREILELHTLGSDGGYTQDDVIAFATALTGRTTTATPRAEGRTDPVTGYVFSPRIHESGARTVLGKRYPQSGEEQGDAILEDLARHPATAQRVAAKFARHFLGDAPPAAAVEDLARVFSETDGDLAALAKAVLRQEGAFDPTPRKFKTTEEFLVSTLRALDPVEADALAIGRAYRAMGQRPWSAPSPEGWPDTSDAWSGPDAIKKRLDWATNTGRRQPNLRPLDLLDRVLGPLASERTRRAVDLAATGPQGLALVLMSPEFQRR